VAAPRVIIADSSSETHEPLIQWLGERGIEVSHVRSASHCIEEVNAPNVMAAIIDDALPDSCGYETLVAVKEVRPTLPLIFTTEHHTPETEVKARRVGILYYGVKPLHRKALMLVMDRIMQALPAS